MRTSQTQDIAYFPGCSLATTARENNTALQEVFRHIGYNLVELPDWNCCGSSSAHSINPELATELASRNLSLVPKNSPLLVACPSCLLRLRQAHLEIRRSEALQERYQGTWGVPFDPDLQILHFFELLDRVELPGRFDDRLKGLKIAPYYGCMLARPPAMKNEKNYHGLLEKLLETFGAEAVRWPYGSRCCGTFLSVARPDVVTPMVNEIVRGAAQSEADCIVTACVMCQMNLEIRCDLKERIPIIPLSQILTIALQLAPGRCDKMLRQHIVDPRPMLRSAGVL